jgi:hypothetical protein
VCCPSKGEAEGGEGPGDGCIRGPRAGEAREKSLVRHLLVTAKLKGRNQQSTMDGIDRLRFPSRERERVRASSVQII